MDLNRLFPAVSRGERDALKEIYDAYRIPFYFAALSILKNEDDALAVAAEAFRRIRDSAYRFDEDLNAEYWLIDVLLTLSYNKRSARGAERENSGNQVLPEILKQEPELFVKIFTELGSNEIAGLADKKKSAVTGLFAEKKNLLDAIRKAAENNCPDYWEQILSGAPTGVEAIPHNVRTETELQERSQRRGHYKWILGVVLLVCFVCAGIAGFAMLLRDHNSGNAEKNDTDKSELLQFNNHIAMTEMNGAIYFRGANNAFYKRNMETGESVKLSDDSPKELLNDGSYIYYRNHTDGYLYRIDPDGGNRQRLCDVPGSAMALHKGFLYFSSTGGIYRIPASGGTFETAEQILDTSGDANLFCVDIALDAGGNVFFASGVGKGIHHVTEYGGKPSVDGIFTEEAYTIQIDGDQLYFDYKEASGNIILYRFDLKAYLEGDEKRVLPTVVRNADGTAIPLSTGAFYVKDGCIYYAGVSDGKPALYKLDETGQESEILRIPSGSLPAGQLSITDLSVTDEWAYCFCSDGKSGGKRKFFAGNLNKNETVTIYES